MDFIIVTTIYFFITLSGAYIIYKCTPDKIIDFIANKIF